MFRSAVLIIIVFYAAPAWADAAAEARFHDQLARRYYAAQKYEAALQEFFMEQRLAPNPRILFNIAICFELLRRDNEAYVYYREYLASTDADPERRAHAAGAVARVEAAAAILSITSVPAGATIYVDQREHGAYGRTPNRLPVDPGTHRIRAEREGHRPAELTVRAERGKESAVHLELEQILGELVLTSSVATIVEVRTSSGAVIARAPPGELALAPGVYEVRAQAKGFEDYLAPVAISADRVTAHAIRLRALPPPTGDVTVTSNISGAVVSLNGEAAGFTPAVLRNVPAGRYVLDVESSGLAKWSGDLEVRENERAWATVTLEQPSVESRSVATWIVGGAGVAAIAGGVVLGALAIAKRDEVYDALERDEPALDLLGEAKTLNTTATGFLVSGAAAIAAGAVLYWATTEREERESSATVARGSR